VVAVHAVSDEVDVRTTGCVVDRVERVLDDEVGVLFVLFAFEVRGPRAVVVLVGDWVDVVDGVGTAHARFDVLEAGDDGAEHIRVN